MTTTQHPAPWRFEARPLGDVLFDAAGGHIGLVETGTGESIVRAVNNLNELIDTLKGCADMLSEAGNMFRASGYPGHGNMAHVHRDRARELLDKVKVGIS